MQPKHPALPQPQLAAGAGHKRQLELACTRGRAVQSFPTWPRGAESAKEEKEEKEEEETAAVRSVLLAVRIPTAEGCSGIDPDLQLVLALCWLHPDKGQ